MTTNKILTTFKERLIGYTIPNYGKEVVVEYEDAVAVLADILKEVDKEKYLQEDRKYDLWGQEIGLRKDI